jgi:hypothetical protein
MMTATPPASSRIRCPICLDVFDFDSQAQDDLYEFSGGQHVKLEIPEGADEVKRKDLLSAAYLKCPNPSGDTGTHYLPRAYASYLPPLVIGMVGDTLSGKSHLLAAMIAEIIKGGLQPYGLTFAPVDQDRHDMYRRDRAERLVIDNMRLKGTKEDIPRYADALLITSSAGTRPVAFFDVGGGDLLDRGDTSRFLVGADGLIFVVDPGTAFGMTTPEDLPKGRAGSDLAFDSVLARLGAGKQFLPVPAALVINKADRLRLRPPADHWLRATTTDGQIDAARWRDESRDAYALLYQHGALAWLRPFHECQRCTIHFVSATGSEARGDSFVRRVRPRRVLEPLLALLAMTGALPGVEASKVGYP